MTALTGDPTIHVRPNAFSRLLANVIGNALRYADNIRVEAIHTQGLADRHLDDDGPGIPADRRDDVFKPFVRLDEARNLDASGTGLGLSIARDIARSHGGDITLDRQPDGRPARHRARPRLSWNSVRPSIHVPVMKRCSKARHAPRSNQRPDELFRESRRRPG